MTIGANIKKLRKEKGLTQKQLGELCGMADSAIRRYESDRGNPTEKTLMRIASALSVPREVLSFDCIDKSDIEQWSGEPLFHSSKEKEIFYDEIRRTLEIRDLNRIDAFLQSANGRLIISAYSELNELGQSEAAKRVVEMTELKQYQQQRPEPPETVLEDGEYTKTTPKQEKPPEGQKKPTDGK